MVQLSDNFDLARMPHLLVAGSTGSGKSVAVNGIIFSILMKARPDEVKFMMVDQRWWSFSVYNDILTSWFQWWPTHVKASRAGPARKVVDGWKIALRLFSKVGARNIAATLIAKVAEVQCQSEMKQVPLPLIVVIVDELADLMMVASKEVEDAIIREKPDCPEGACGGGPWSWRLSHRLKRYLRFDQGQCGILRSYIALCGIICRDRLWTILADENGAEKLLGRGDMLFKPIDENHQSVYKGSALSQMTMWSEIVDFQSKSRRSRLWSDESHSQSRGLDCWWTLWFVYRQ